MKGPLSFRIVWGKRQDGTRGYRVRVKDGNNKLIFWTQVYKYRSSARHAIALMKDHAANGRVIDLTAS